MMVTTMGDGQTPVFTLAHEELGPLRRFAPVLDRVLGLHRLEEVYAALPHDAALGDFLARALDRLGVSLQPDETQLQKIPAEGPLVVVANHPFGGIEGLALARVLLERRPDTKVMANYLLGRIPKLAPLFFQVNPFDSPQAARQNVAALRSTVRHVRQGGLLVVFPAGEVAHLNLRTRRVEDPPWDPTIARIIRRAECPVVPVRFAGHCGAWFQLLGLVHPVLRTLMLPRELLKRRGETLRLAVGSVLSARVLAEWPTNRELIAYLRRRVEVLAERGDGERGASVPTPARVVQSVAPPVPASELAAEIAALPPEACLVDAPKQQVFMATADRIPKLLDEIGRLRELTFRAVGEGTGRGRDLDVFDQSYHHLFVWNRDPAEVVGAYRIGFSDQLLAAGGVDALYTSTLFRFDATLFDHLGPALEMGRSFIRVEHQRSFNGLMLLWKGIGQVVLRHPRYFTLFGPVSISADYLAASQQLLVDYLGGAPYTHEWQRWVRPRSPFRKHSRRNFLPSPADLRSLDEVSQFIAEMEADGKGVPILLRQYLKLGGRLLGFNVDPDFSNVLDVLLMVDLRRTEAATLARYMGKDGADEFVARHRP